MRFLSLEWVWKLCMLTCSSATHLKNEVKTNPKLGFWKMLRLSFFKNKRKKYYHQAYTHVKPKKTVGGEGGVLVPKIYRMNHNLKRIIATRRKF